MWRQQFEQRLDAAVEEKYDNLERTAADNEHELSRLKQNEQHRKTQDAVLNLNEHLNILVFPADLQQMVPIKEDPEEWRSGVDQKDLEPLNIKKEEEETDATRISFTAVFSQCDEDKEKVLLPQFDQHKTEDDDLPTSSSIDQMKAATGGEDCGGAESPGNPYLSPHENDSISSETDVSEDDEDDQDGINSDFLIRFLTDNEPETEDSNKNWKESTSSESNSEIVNKPFSCSECGKQFLHRLSLQKHVISRSGIRSSGCLLDGKCVGMEENVESNRKVQTEVKSFSCDDCGKIFSRKSCLNRHKRIHTGEKPFACDVCGQKFRQKTHFKSHMRVHTGQKPFICDVCGQSFRHKPGLSTHMRIHTGQKPFICDFCGQRFRHKPGLSTHTRIHTGQKPFACEICGQRFNHKSHLNPHMRIHTGQKPFGCDVCGQRFSQKASLIRHLSVHTGQKLFACDVCGDRFRHKSGLNTHTRIHTENEALM